MCVVFPRCLVFFLDGAASIIGSVIFEESNAMTLNVKTKWWLCLEVVIFCGPRCY